MPKLTKRFIDSIEANGSDQVFWDSEVKRFGVRVMPSGIRTYVLQYRNEQGRTRKLALARVGELTPEEAFWGTSVPLEIPLRRICRACGGRGEVWEQWCAECEGGGDVARQHPLRLRVPAGVRAGARFRFSIMPPGAAPTLVEVRISVR